MERLNWVVLGLMGVVTALGLTTSSGAGKSKTDLAESERNFQKATELSTVTLGGVHPKHAIEENVANLVATSNTPPCSACQAGGVCCDKGTTKSDPSSTAFVHDTQIVCQGICTNETKQQAATVADSLKKLLQAKGPYVSGKEIDQAVAVAAGTEKAACADCPLAKAGEAVLNLTKNFVCEGGECLADKKPATLTITAVDPAPAKPEGLLNLLAAAEAAKPATGEATFTITVDATKLEPAIPPADNSRAAARAAKLAELEKKMAEPSQLLLNQNKLNDIIDSVRKNYGVPVLRDWKALDEMAFEDATPFDDEAQPELELGEHLRTVLNRQGLTWMIPASCDYVLITSTVTMENTSVIKVYDVTDFLADQQTTPDEFLVNIITVVQPPTWKANGGQADLSLLRNGNRAYLTVTNNYWALRCLNHLFEDLRLAQIK